MSEALRKPLAMIDVRKGGNVPLAVLALLACSVPLLMRSEYALFVATQIGIYLLVAVGLNFLAGYGGQVSLGHGALFAIGAYATAIAMADHQWSFWQGAALSIACSVALGVAMALPAFRVNSWYFALITLGFAKVFSGLLTELTGLTHGFAGVVGIGMPAIGDYVFSSRTLYLFVIALNVLFFWTTANLVRSRHGRALQAVRDNDLAATSSGVSTVTTKLFAFVVSAAAAGIAGALFAVQKTVITPDDFTSDFSLFFLLVVVVGGSGRLWGPVVGTIVMFLLPDLLTALGSWRMLIYGLLLLAMMAFAPHGLVALLESAARRLLKGRSAAPAERPPAAIAEDRSRVEGARLSVGKLQKSFGGVKALDGIDFEVPAGAIRCIVGPNGSGKTTLLNLISGYYGPSNGQVVLDDVPLTGLSAREIARRGVGRTFQTPRLLPELTVLENVMLGAYVQEHATWLELALSLPRARRERRALEAAAMRYLTFVGIAEKWNEPAGELPHGQQRLTEIARALMGRPRLLLLDEPAAGLSLSEVNRLSALITDIRAVGITVIVVEHDMDLVSSVGDSVLVLDRGQVLAQGALAAVMTDPAVISAYMGKTVKEAAPSGPAADPQAAREAS